MEPSESLTVSSSPTPKEEKEEPQPPSMEEEASPPTASATPPTSPTMETELQKSTPSSKNDEPTPKVKPTKKGGAKKVVVKSPTPPTPEEDPTPQSPSETVSTLSTPSPSTSPQPPPSPGTLRGRTLPPPRPKPELDHTPHKSAPPSPRLPKGVLPPIPPETYLWEDVKRQRAMGGYPWSHLDKPPLGSKENLECSEEVDDFLRRHAWLQSSCRSNFGHTFHGTSHSTPALNLESDHEYEIINPPPPRVDVDPPSDERKAGVDFAVCTPRKRLDSETSSLASGDPNFHHVPLRGGDVVDSAKEDLSAQELQACMEERFFAATPETTASRTDCDVNTSQLDSSGLEDLPLRRGSRKKKDDRETEARGLQQKIRSQAGRLRAKLRSMKMPERPKFNMPERPKFNMPERPKFNLPERPKFNLPERPKFNLPERPKFNLPDRPKFKMPERPKFNMPNMPTMPSMPTFSKREKPAKKSSSTRRPLRERNNPSTESNASSSRKHTFFDFDFKTYPRLFDRARKKGGEYATSSPKSMTPPPSMESDRPPMPTRRKGPVGSRWVHRFNDIKYADDEDPRRMEEEFEEEPFRRNMDFRMNQEEMEPEDEEEMRREKIRYENEVRDAVEEMDRQRQERESIHTESTTAFRDKDYDYAVGLHLGEINHPQKNESIPESNREERSSGGSSGRHRRGVLEEIDSDEFFLRQKGISQEDVDMGRYLTSEIREAFRPPTNTLSQMDYDEEEEEPADSLGNQYRGTPEREPIPPARTRSLKPRKRTNRTPTSVDEEAPPSPSFNTFPPARPRRHRRQQEELQQQEPEYMQDEVEEPEEVGYEEDEDEGETEPAKGGDDEWQDMDMDVEVEEPPPTVPRRVRRSRPEPVQREYVPEAQRNGHVWEDEIVPQEVVALRMEHEYIIPGEPEPTPVAPKRERRRAPSRTSGHSLAEDRTSRAADSLPRDDIPTSDDLEEDQNICEMAEEMAEEVAQEPTLIEQEQQQQQRAPTRPVSQDIDGYATVEKIYPVKPPRPNRPKPPRPPAPVRRKRLGNHFFSLPRKAPPVRPLRNYSTLGPSRPLRREKAHKSESYIEIEDDLGPSATEESQPSNREDLKSGDVVERMKGRPLPAPPRPPRKTKDGQEAEPDVEKEEKTEAELLTFTLTDTSEHALGALNDAVFYSAKESIAPVAKEMSMAASSAPAQQTETPSEQKQEVKPSEEVLQPSDEVLQKSEEVLQKSEEVLQSSEVPVPERAPSSKPEEISPSQAAEPSAAEERQAFLVPDSISVETQPFEEVTVATQTDPLPDDYCMDVEEESPEHADACTDTMDIQRRDSEAKLAAVPVSEEPARVRLEAQVQQQPPALPPRPVTPPPPPPPTIIEREVPVYIMPDKDTVIELKAERLQVGDLDVERLNVGELQAQKILVSDIDGVSLQVAELISKSGRLFVNGIELPPGFLQELYDAFPRPEPVPQSQPVSRPSEPQSESITTSQVSPSETVTTFRAPKSEKISEPVETKSETFSTLQLQQSETISPTTIPQSEMTFTQSMPQKDVISQISVSQSAPPIPPPPAPQSIPMTQQQMYTEPPTIPLGPSSISSLQHEPVPPSIPPPPLHIPMDPRYSYIPSAMRVKRSQIPDLESEEELISFIPSSHRRRRHHAPKPVPRYSSDEEEEAVSFQPRRHPQRNDPSVADLSRQLGQAVTSSSMRALRSLIQYTTTQLEGEDKRRELQTVLCILLILVAGLILMGFGAGKTFHYHHWDYLNPPK